MVTFPYHCKYFLFCLFKENFEGDKTSLLQSDTFCYRVNKLGRIWPQPFTLRNNPILTLLPLKPLLFTFLIGYYECNYCYNVKIT